MKKVVLLICLFSPLFLSSQFELNFGGGINYNVGDGVVRNFGRIGEISIANRESEDWYYRASVQFVENVWTEGFNIGASDQNKSRYQYLSIMPQIEWLPGKAIGFVGGIYSGLLLSERFYFVNEKKWIKQEGIGRNRKVDPGLMIGTNIYLGTFSFGIHYTRSLFKIKHEPVNSFSSFFPVRRNTGIQLKLGYFFSIGENEFEK